MHLFPLHLKSSKGLLPALKLVKPMMMAQVEVCRRPSVSPPAILDPPPHLARQAAPSTSQSEDERGQGIEWDRFQDLMQQQQEQIPPARAEAAGDITSTPAQTGVLLNGDTSEIEEPEGGVNTSTNSTDSTVDDSFDRNICIPGSRDGKNWYPDALVESDGWDHEVYHERFIFVSGELKKAVDSDPDLRDQARNIHYRPAMVGTSPETVRPTIVVLCPTKAFNQLRTLFNNQLRSRLYCDKKSSSFPWFLKNRDPRPPVPPFQLVYYRTPGNPLIQLASRIPLEAHFNTDLTWCGGLIQYLERTATLGLSIQVDAMHGVLTVDHLFPPIVSETIAEPSSTSLPTASGDSDSSSPNGEGIAALSDLCFEDCEGYLEVEELFEDDGKQDDTIVNPCLLKHSVADKRSEEWERIVTQVDRLDSSAPYLDWALTKPRDPNTSAHLANVFFPSGKNGDCITLKKLAKKPRKHRAAVYVISGVRGILPGRILASSMMIGSAPGQELCEVWAVAIDSGSGIMKGECGSIVVDQDTNEVYGHIIGSDPFGHAYVVPLERVLSQIKTCFAADQVGILTSFGPPSTTIETGGKLRDIEKNEIASIEKLVHSSPQSLVEMQINDENVQDTIPSARHIDEPTPNTTVLESSGILNRSTLPVAELTVDFDSIQALETPVLTVQKEMLRNSPLETTTRDSPFGFSLNYHPDSSLPGVFSWPKIAQRREIKRLRVGKIHNPLQNISDIQLRADVHNFYQNTVKTLTRSRPYPTEKELQEAVMIAKHYIHYDTAARTNSPNVIPVAITETERRALNNEADRIFPERGGMWMVILTVILSAFLQGLVQSSQNGANLFSYQWIGQSEGVNLRFAFTNAAVYFTAAILGCPFAVPLNSLLGRRGVIFIAAFLTCGASLASALIRLDENRGWALLSAIRVIGGVGMGLKAVTAPILAAEISVGHWRGSFMLMWHLWVSFGTMASFMINICLNSIHDEKLKLRLIMASPAGVAFCLMLIVYKCPESPQHYMIRESRHYSPEKAFESLMRLRNTKVQATRDLFLTYMGIEEEFKFETEARQSGGIQSTSTTSDHPRDEQITSYNHPDNDSGAERAALSGSGIVRGDLFSRIVVYTRDISKAIIHYVLRCGKLLATRRLRNAVIASCVAALSQQLSGINIMAFYGGSVLVGSVPGQKIKNNMLHKVMEYNVIFGVLKFVFSLPAIPFINSLGRRKMLIFTIPGMAMVLMAAAVSFSTVKVEVVSFWIYIHTIFYSSGMGSVPFILAVESFPLAFRETGASLAISINFFYAGVLALSYPLLVENLKVSGTLGLFAGYNIIAFILVFLLVEETSGVRPEDLGLVFGKRKSEFIRFQLFEFLPWLGKFLSGGSRLEDRPKWMVNYEQAKEQCNVREGVVIEE